MRFKKNNITAALLILSIGLFFPTISNAECYYGPGVCKMKTRTKCEELYNDADFYAQMCRSHYSFYYPADPLPNGYPGEDFYDKVCLCETWTIDCKGKGDFSIVCP
jgi:hypothetical protein